MGIFLPEEEEALFFLVSLPGAMVVLNVEVDLEEFPVKLELEVGVVVTIKC